MHISNGGHQGSPRTMRQTALTVPDTVATLQSDSLARGHSTLSSFNVLKVLVSLLLASNPAAAFSLYGPGSRHAVVNPRMQGRAISHTAAVASGRQDLSGQRIPRVVMSDAESNSTSDVPDATQVDEMSGGRFSDIKKALVAGATGGTGRAIVDRLLKEGLTVRALVRDASSASLPPEVELVEGDVYEYGTLPRAVEGCDVVLCATGNRPSVTDPLGPFKVDYIGTGNLASAARNAGAKKFVFVSSIAADELLYPLNLAFGVLFWKKRGEELLQRSGLDYTIVRPGGLKNDGGKLPVVMERENTFGLPPARRQAGSILRSQVADLCVEALVIPASSNKIVEVIAVDGEPERLPEELYAAVS